MSISRERYEQIFQDIDRMGRDLAIVKLRDEGFTQRAIGELLNISTERVRQLEYRGRRTSKKSVKLTKGK